jgi:hypothetical protein
MCNTMLRVAILLGFNVLLIIVFCGMSFCHFDGRTNNVTVIDIISVDPAPCRPIVQKSKMRLVLSRS